MHLTSPVRSYGGPQTTSTRNMAVSVRSGPSRAFSSLCEQTGSRRCVVTHSLKRLAVFVSGGGSNLQQIHKACSAGHIEGEVLAVVTDVPTCGGAAFAQSNNIKVLVYPPKASAAQVQEGVIALESEQHLTETLQGELKIDFVVLAGYLKLVPALTVAAFSRRMLNIHPSLLPAFGGKGMFGKKVHKAVIASGCRYSGPTVHFVDEEYDTGPILAQKAVPCYPNDTPDTLAARVLQQEHELYPKAVAALCDERVGWREDGVPYIWHQV